MYRSDTPSDDQTNTTNNNPNKSESAGKAGSSVFKMPLFPLGSVLFPHMPLPLHIFEERYRRMIREHQSDDPIFGVVLTRQGREVGDQPEIHSVGTSASLIGLRDYPDGRYDVAVRGERRFKVLDQDWSRQYLIGSIEYLPEVAIAPDDHQKLIDRANNAYVQLVRALARAAERPVEPDELPTDPEELAFVLAAALPINSWELQSLLEQPTTASRLELVISILHRERHLLTETGAAGPAVENPGSRFLPN